MILDSNIIIGAAKPGGQFLIPFLRDPDAGVSIVTRIEPLGFHQLAVDERILISNALALLSELPLDHEIAGRAVLLHQRRPMKLGDAIIAATALEYDLPLATRNTRDFRHIEGLTLIDPFASDKDPEPANPSDV
jgi:predicted nucleic acid-binding protein